MARRTDTEAETKDTKTIFMGVPWRALRKEFVM